MPKRVMDLGRSSTRATLALFACWVGGCAGSSRLERGDRVRIEASRFGTNPVEATFMAAGPDSLRLLQDPNQAIALPWAEIRSFEVGHGRSRKTGWGAALGAVAGIVTGAALGNQQCEQDDSGLEAYCGLYGAGLLVIPGAGLGALAGSFVRGEERWERIPPETIRMKAIDGTR